MPRRTGPRSLTEEKKIQQWVILGGDDDDAHGFHCLVETKKPICGIPVEEL